MYYEKSAIIKVAFSLENVPMLTNKDTYQLNLQHAIFYFFSDYFPEIYFLQNFMVLSTIIKILFKISRDQMLLSKQTQWLLNLLRSLE